MSADSFEVKIEEWDYLNGDHTHEKIYYIAVEKGSHTDSQSNSIVAGDVDVNHNWGSVSESTEFSTNPVVFTQSQTYNGGNPIVTRVKNRSGASSNLSFDVRVQEEEARGPHRTETVGYLACERFAEGIFDNRRYFAISDLVDDEWNKVGFSGRYELPHFIADIQSFNGSDPAGLRYASLTNDSVERVVEEEQSSDSETDHVRESVGTLVVESAKKTFGDKGEVGDLRRNQPSPGTWHSIDFLQPYVDPVVIMGPLSYNGAQPAHLRVRDVQATGFEFKIEEWQYLNNRRHTGEWFYYMVLEEGVYFTEDNNYLHVGTVETDHQFTTVSASGSYNTPVVLTQPQTFNGPNPIVSRIKDVQRDSFLSFDVRVQEEEANGAHATETVGYIALESGISGDTDSFQGVEFLPRVTPNAITDDWSKRQFDHLIYDRLFLADIQTFNGSDPAELRYRDLFPTSVEVMVEEEQSGDSETNHVNAESVGYVVFENAF